MGFEVGNGQRHVVKCVDQRIDDLSLLGGIVDAQSFRKTLDIRGSLRNRHGCQPPFVSNVYGKAALTHAPYTRRYVYPP